MADILNFIDNVKPILTFNGKEYKVNKSYKVSIYLSAKHKEIETKKKNVKDFDEVQANIDLLFETFEKTISKEFKEEVDALDLSETQLMRLFNVINYMRGGLTQEQAIEKVVEEEKNPEEKKA